MSFSRQLVTVTFIILTGQTSLNEVLGRGQMTHFGTVGETIGDM